MGEMRERNTHPHRRLEKTSIVSTKFVTRISPCRPLPPQRALSSSYSPFRRALAPFPIDAELSSKLPSKPSRPCT